MSGIKFNILAMDKTAQAFGSVRAKLDGLGKAVDGLDRKFGGFGKGLIAAFAGGIVKSLVDSTSKMDDFAQRLGISTASLSELAYVAKMGGVELDGLGNSIRSMEVRLAQAADGTGKAAGALKALGLDAMELKNSSPDEAFTKIVQAMSGVENQSDKAKLAMDLFGKSGTDLIPIMNGGAESISALRKDMQDLGATIDSQAAGNIASLGDAWDRMSIAIAGAGRHILAFFAPALEFIMDLIAEAFSLINKLMKGVRILGNGFAIWGKRTGEFLGILSSEEANASIKKNGDAIRELWNGTQGASNSAAKLKQNFDRAGASADSMVRKLKPISIDSSASKNNNNIAKTVASPAIKSLDEIKTKTDETTINMRAAFRESLEGIGEDFKGLGDVVSNVYNRIRQDMVGKASNILIDKTLNAGEGLFNGLMQDIFRTSSSSVGPANVPSLTDFFGGFFADGGTFSGGKPIMVGERGPEMIIPQRGGTVIPNHQLGGSNVNIHMNIQTPDVAGFKQSQSQIAASAAMAMQRATRNI